MFKKIKEFFRGTKPLGGVYYDSYELNNMNTQHKKNYISCCLGNYTMYLYNDDEEIRVLAGCRDFSLEDARKHWSSKNYNNWSFPTPDYGKRQLRMLAFLKGEARLLGWIK